MKKMYFASVLCTIGCFASDLHGTPGDVAQGFYRKFERSELLGLPDQKTMEKLRPYLSKGLIKQIERAKKVEDQYLAGVKDSEPGPSEGWNLFYRNYEGATSVVTKSSKEESRTAIVIIECKYEESSPTTSSSWLLQVSLVLENGKWLIDDRTPIEGGKVDEANSLRAELEKFCEENAPASGSH